MKSQTNIGRPFIKYTLSMDVHNEILNGVNTALLPFYIENSDILVSYDGSLNMNNQLSQNVTIMDSKMKDDSIPSGNHYNEALPLFEEIILVLKQRVIQRNNK